MGSGVLCRACCGKFGEGEFGGIRWVLGKWREARWRVLQEWV